MFAAAYFAPREYAPRYFPKTGAALPVIVSAPSGGAADDARRKYLAWKRKQKRKAVPENAIILPDPIIKEQQSPEEPELLIQAASAVAMMEFPKRTPNVIGPAVERELLRLREEMIQVKQGDDEIAFMMLL